MMSQVNTRSDSLASIPAGSSDHVAEARVRDSWGDAAGKHWSVVEMTLENLVNRSAASLVILRFVLGIIGLYKTNLPMFLVVHPGDATWKISCSRSCLSGIHGVGSKK